jgi:hypothetical protein
VSKEPKSNGSFIFASCDELHLPLPALVCLQGTARIYLIWKSIDLVKLNFMLYGLSPNDGEVGL